MNIFSSILNWLARGYEIEYMNDYGPLELAENQGPFDDNLIDCPPIGSPEWDDWVEGKKGLE